MTKKRGRAPVDAAAPDYDARRQRRSARRNAAEAAAAIPAGPGARTRRVGTAFDAKATIATAVRNSV